MYALNRNKVKTKYSYLKINCFFKCVKFFKKMYNKQSVQCRKEKYFGGIVLICIRNVYSN